MVLCVREKEEGRESVTEGKKGTRGWLAGKYIKAVFCFLLFTLIKETPIHDSYNQKNRLALGSSIGYNQTMKTWSVFTFQLEKLDPES